jgi:hypothetical protein
MFQKFSHWIRTKTGLVTVAVVVVLALVVAVAGGQMGWFGGTGAAGIPPATPTCPQAPTTYNVENPVKVPYYGINYVFAAGPEVKNGSADTFTYTIPAAAAKTMSRIIVQPTNTSTTGQVVITACAFWLKAACNKLAPDNSGQFKAQFVGSTDNGDGTLTLKYYVQNLGSDPLTSVLIGLPDGVIPSAPTTTFNGQTCQ